MHFSHCHSLIGFIIWPLPEPCGLRSMTKAFIPKAMVRLWQQKFLLKHRPRQAVGRSQDRATPLYVLISELIPYPSLYLMTQTNANEIITLTPIQPRRLVQSLTRSCYIRLLERILGKDGAGNNAVWEVTFFCCISTMMTILCVI
jgi:hypothetical protein